MMVQSIENMPKSDAKNDLLDKTMLFERYIKEIQDYTMDIRMVKIGEMFNKYKLLIEDISQKNDKNIDVITYGNDTKIDKIMIENLDLALKKIVENAVIHGIETSTQREENKKYKKGKLSITAAQLSEQISICVQDDGRGVDEEKIVKEALQNGSVTYEEVSQMSYEEKASLLAYVGTMNEIRIEVDKLGGSIEITSIKGEETSITIYMPLALSIMDGLNVRIGKSIFILPSSSIVESLQPDKSMIKSVGDGTHELLMIREEFIPVIRLYEYLNIEADIKELYKGMIIIVKSRSQKAALFVDEFLQQQQIVVKSIDTNYKKSMGISGATVKGDGSIGLILDVKSMINDIKEQRGI
jgi:two-component system chemotaxis sensor kinase CheA